MAIIYCMHSCAEIITFENEVISKLKSCQRILQKYYLDNSVLVLGGWTSHRPGANWLTLWQIRVTASNVELRIAILSLPPINVFCRQLSLTNPLATEDGRNYQSCPFRFRWRTQTLISLTQTAAIISRMTFPCRAIPPIDPIHLTSSSK